MDFRARHPQIFGTGESLGYEGYALAAPWTLVEVKDGRALSKMDRGLFLSSNCLSNWNVYWGSMFSAFTKNIDRGLQAALQYLPWSERGDYILTLGSMYGLRWYLELYGSSHAAATSTTFPRSSKSPSARNSP